VHRALLSSPVQRAPGWPRIFEKISGAGAPENTLLLSARTESVTSKAAKPEVQGAESKLDDADSEKPKRSPDKRSDNTPDTSQEQDYPGSYPDPDDIRLSVSLC
jgi:hypothetical protein